MSHLFRHLLGRWNICLILLLGPLIIFPVLVQPAAEAVVQHGQGAPKILDEYVMTWTPDEARHLYEAIGPEGREGIRQFYLRLDFWLPVFSLMLFYISLLSLAFPASSRLAWLNLLPIPMWLLDEAENINHFSMATSYPDWSPLSLTVGPWLTFWKWVFIFAIPAIAAFGFASRGLGRTHSTAR